LIFLDTLLPDLCLSVYRTTTTTTPLFIIIFSIFIIVVFVLSFVRPTNRYISTYYVRRGIDFGSFKRDVLLFKSLALLQLVYHYCFPTTRPFEFDALSVLMIVGGYTVSVMATNAIGIDRTYFGAELGLVEPKWIDQFPYGYVLVCFFVCFISMFFFLVLLLFFLFLLCALCEWRVVRRALLLLVACANFFFVFLCMFRYIPHPMITSQVVALLGFYKAAHYRAEWPYVIPIHVLLYLVHMMQEQFDFYRVYPDVPSGAAAAARKTKSE
jgi:hypothetical protein